MVMNAEHNNSDNYERITDSFVLTQKRELLIRMFRNQIKAQELLKT